MIDLVVYKYVDALFSKQNELNGIKSSLNNLAKAFEDKKFCEIIDSYEIAKEKKVELLLSLTDNKYVQNLIKLLAIKNRLNLIPQIASALNKKINIANNIYDGVVYSKEPLNKDELNEINEKFSKKFQIKLNLTNISGDYEGIKVSIEDLGVEVGFSKSLIQSQLKEFILKAV